ncbi:MAG: dihydroorotase [Planctomycetota bacterium]
MKILIKNAKVVLPEQVRESAILIEDSKILDVDASDTASADEVVDASGQWLIPGVVDDQVHFREPGLTHKEDLHHATRACAKGGVTSFLEMPNTIPNTVTQTELDRKLETASKSCLVNYGFYIGATPSNVDDLKHAKRTPGIKIFIGSSTGNLLVDEQSALEKIFRETTLSICAHCEDESTVRSNLKKHAGSTDVSTHSLVRDHEAALVATKRAIALANEYQHHFHVLHVSTGQEVDACLVNRSQYITAEVCPHHLFFNFDDYERLGSLIKMNPSVKYFEDNQRLWQALLEGDIDIIATDHAPHTIEEKKLPYPDCPSGLPAVENSLALLLNQVHQGECSIQQVVQWMCTRPAEIWKLKNKGKIAVGYDADLVLVDPNLKQTVSNETQQTKCQWSPWAGEELMGWPVTTWVMGQKVYQWTEQEPQFAESPVGCEIEFEKTAS